MAFKNYFHGCSRRVGCLIILWFFFIVNCIRLGYYMAHLRLLDHKSPHFSIQMIYGLYQEFTCMVGIFCSSSGIGAIQKNKAQILLRFYYYLYYTIVFALASAFFLVFFPSLYWTVVGVNDGLITVISCRWELRAAMFLLCSSVQAYFLVVIKNYYVMATKRVDQETKAPDET